MEKDNNNNNNNHTNNNNATFPPLQNDRFLRACRGEEPLDELPVWIMRQAGRYLPQFKKVRADSGKTFFEVCRDPELATTLTIQPIDHFQGKLDAAIIFSDILVIPQALGLEVKMEEAQGPVVTQPILTPDDLKRLKTSADVENELGYVGKAISRTRMELKGRVPLIGFTGAPWTLFCYMTRPTTAGGQKNWNAAQTWLYKHKEASHSLLRLISDAVADFLIFQAKSGAQALQVFDSWASELSVDTFRSFCLPYYIDIATRVKQACPDIPLILFAKGANHSISQLALLGYDVLGLDWTIEGTDARKLVGDKVSLQGNLNPCVLYSTKEEIYAQVKRMLQDFGVNRYIVNLGHGLLPDHNPEHVGWFLDAVKEISREMIAKKHAKK